MGIDLEGLGPTARLELPLEPAAPPVRQVRTRINLPQLKVGEYRGDCVHQYEWDNWTGPPGALRGRSNHGAMAWAVSLEF